MSFAHPWMLLGAAAALIPLLIHLFDRRRPRPHPFAAIAFVLRSQRRTASRLRLKRLLLYALRTLILLAVPLALARPEWRRSGAAHVVATGPAATAIVLDRSLAMRWSDGESLFERGRREARAALQSLQGEEPVAFVPCGPEMGVPAPAGFDRGRIREQIDEVHPAWQGADLNRCLDLATRVLEESPMPGKRIVLVSAFTASALHLEVPPPTLLAAGKRVHPEVVLRDVAGGRPALSNHFLSEVKAEPATQVGPGAVQVTLTARNASGAAARDVPAIVEVGGRVVAKTFLDLPAGGSALKALSWRSEATGALVATVALPADGLAEDDRHQVVVHVPRPIRVLVVDGAPSPTRYRDEAFFLEAALTAPGSPVRPTVRDPDAAFREKLEDYDVVALLNVAAPSAEDAGRLRAFVEGGGGLFLSMGDRVEPEAYDLRFGELLPRPLRLVKTAGTGSEGETRPARLGDVRLDHPLFGLFTGKAREGLEGARFSKYMLLEAAPGRAGGSEILAAFDDGAPAIALARRGRGRVLLYTSTVDRDWGDLAIRTSFLPLMQRSAAFLAGALDERERVEGRVGQTVTLPSDAQAPIVAVHGPGGDAVPVRPQPDGKVRVGPFATPGVYTPFLGSRQPLPEARFAVTLDPADSDLTRVKPDALAAYFGEEAVKSAGAGAERRVPLWTWLVVAAALAFFLEGSVLRKP